MNEKVKQVLNVILEKFKSGDIPEAVALASYPIPDIPSSKWSFTNRTIMFLSGTGDARGFRQWKQAERWVKKGAKAIYILVPCFLKQVDEETGEEKEVLRFFKWSNGKCNRRTAYCCRDKSTIDKTENASIIGRMGNCKICIGSVY